MESILATLTDKAKERYLFNAASPEASEIDIFGEIDDFWGFGVRQMAYDLSQIRKDQALTIRIHSPGGLVTEGLGIRSLIMAHPGQTTTRGVGFVASIASVILMAGDRVEMADNSFLMIHRPWAAMFGGTSEDLREQADLLDKMEMNLAEIYAGQMVKRKKRMSYQEALALALQWMDAETWFTAQEALDAGLIDAVTGSEKANATQDEFFALARYDNAPEGLILNLLNDRPMSEKKSLLNRLRDMLNATDEEETQAAAEETTDTVTQEQAPEIDPVQAARELLEQSGYSVLSQEDKSEAEKEEAELSELLNSLVSEVKALKEQNKAKAGAPSGGSEKHSDKPTGSRDPFKKQYQNLAAIIKDYVKHAG